MSKATLKKELARFDSAQLTQIILDIYDCNKSAKDYLEFFINPDVEKLRDRFDRAVTKELSRSKWGRSKARISLIRRLLKDFQSFQPGAEAVSGAMLQIITAALAWQHRLDYPQTLADGIAGILEQYVIFCDSHGMLDAALERLDSLLGSSSAAGAPRLRRFLLSRLDAVLASMGLHRSPSE